MVQMNYDIVGIGIKFKIIDILPILLFCQYIEKERFLIETKLFRIYRILTRNEAPKYFTLKNYK